MQSITQSVTIIAAGRRPLAADLRELWRYRDLVYILAWKDIKVRYKQTAIGVVWALLQPLLTMAIFSLVFGRLAGLPSAGLPYPLFYFAALLAWNLFANAVNSGANAIVNNQNLVQKVYLPRLALPLAATAVAVVDALVALPLLLALAGWYGYAPSWALLAIPAFLLLTFAAAAGAALWLAALNAEYRDVKHALPFVLQVLLFASPVAYGLDLVPSEWRWLYALNPLCAAIEGLRWSVTGGGALAMDIGALGALGAAILLLSGLAYFRRADARLADVV